MNCPQPPGGPVNSRLTLGLAACLAVASIAGGCAGSSRRQGGQQLLAGLAVAGLPDSTSEMLADAGQLPCPDGGSREVRIDTLRAAGQLQQLHAVVVYHHCGAAGLDLDGTLFTRVTRHALGVGHQRVTTVVNGRIDFGRRSAWEQSCEVDLSGDDAGGNQGPAVLAGSVCGLPAHLNS